PELAMVNGHWIAIPERDALAPQEQQHALSPLVYQETDGRRRRLFNGFIPVGMRESLLGPKGTSVADDVPDPRVQLLREQVIEPWRTLDDDLVLPFVERWSEPEVLVVDSAAAYQRAATNLTEQLRRGR